jgi:hypothetical protein
MPNRILRADILSSEAIASLKWDEEVFYRRVMSIVDDYGRHEGNPQLLRSKCYPLQTDQVRVADISRWLAACQKAGVILCYDVDGKQYIEVQKFGQKVRTDSKCPPPQTNASKCQQMSANDRLGVCADIGEVEGVVEGVKAHTQRRKKAETHTIPDDFGISDGVRAWASKKGFSRLDDHLESFKLKCRAKSYAYADWDAAFMEAVRNDWAKLGSSPNSTVGNGQSVAASRPMA